MLFTDIEGSTPLLERLGDGAWLALLRHHDALIRDQVRRRRGTEVRRTGDGFMIVFGRPEQAVLCAVGIQRALAQHSLREPERALKVRIGIHAGRILLDASDVQGRNVVVAARIAALAGGGEILASAAVRELAGAAAAAGFDAGHAEVLKGIQGPTIVHRVAWRTAACRPGRDLPPASGEPGTGQPADTLAVRPLGRAPQPMQTGTDVFAKARNHERTDQLRAAREGGFLPYFRVVESPARPVMEMEGAPRIMLGSNNYLGLTGDERVMQGARDALERYGTGLTGSRLLNGTIPLHLELEREIAEWMGTEDAIVFTTGHQANVGTLGTILGPGDTVVADSGDHASILDGCLLSRAKLRPFRHNRLEKLDRQLERAAQDGGGVMVVVDGVFSMEGDIAPLREIAERCARAGARLMVDEAHGAGVLGARGAGTAELLGVEAQVDLRMGTFSKSLASCGGFIAGPADVVDYLRIQSRAFLFTAAAVPAAVGAALAALRIVRSAEGPPLMAQVLENARYLRDGLEERGFAVVAAQSLPGGGDVVTPIVPVLVGDDWKAALLWRALWDAGVFVNTALHPAVPPGGALLRTSVMATHDRATLDAALDAFTTVKASFEVEHGALPGPGSH